MSLKEIRHGRVEKLKKIKIAYPRKTHQKRNKLPQKPSPLLILQPKRLELKLSIKEILAEKFIMLFISMADYFPLLIVW